MALFGTLTCNVYTVSHSLRQIIEGLSSSLGRGAEVASTEEPDAMADKDASLDYNAAIRLTPVAVTESLLWIGGSDTYQTMNIEAPNELNVSCATIPRKKHPTNPRSKIQNVHLLPYLFFSIALDTAAAIQRLAGSPRRCQAASMANLYPDRTAVIKSV